MNERRRLGAKRVCGFLRLSTVGALLVAALATRVAGQVTQRVSVSSIGGQGNSGSSNTPLSVISADGRYVAFSSSAGHFAPEDTNGRADVFVRDRQNGTTRRVSIDSAGAQANEFSSDASISSEGRYVVFTSQATNLVPGDTNGAYDIFVHDRESSTTERASVDSAGGQANNPSYAPSMSSDGRYVVFHSHASNLVPGDTNGHYDVFVRDRLSATTERVSIDSAGGQGNYGGWFASISANGRYVIFRSESTHLVSGDTNASSDAFVHDRQSGTTERVSVDSFGAEGNQVSWASGISADGRYVAFGSRATNLVPGDTNGSDDTFVRDRQSGTTERVSVDLPGSRGTTRAIPARSLPTAAT